MLNFTLVENSTILREGRKEESLPLTKIVFNNLITLQTIFKITILMK